MIYMIMLLNSPGSSTYKRRTLGSPNSVGVITIRDTKENE